MFMIQMRSPRVVLPNVKCVRQLQYLVFARDSDADSVSHRVLCSTYLPRPRLDFLSMTKLQITFFKNFSLVYKVWTGKSVKFEFTQ